MGGYRLAGGCVGRLCPPLIHFFSLQRNSQFPNFVSADHDRPAQIVVGVGGTEMAVPIEMSAKGTKIRGATVAGTESQQKFGYALLSKSKSSWNLELKDRTGQVLVSCPVAEGSAGCQSSGEN